MGLPGLYETILETSGLEVKQALEVRVLAREPPVFDVCRCRYVRAAQRAASKHATCISD